MTRLRVLYFSRTDIGLTDNGGSLCGRSHLRALASDPAIELSVAIAGPKMLEEATRKFTTSLGVELNFLPLTKSRTPDPLRLLRYFPRKYPLAHEKQSRRQRHIDQQFAGVLKDTKPDAVIVDYLPSAFYIPSLFSDSRPRCLITLNREAEFHMEQYATRGANSRSPILKIAYRRWTRVERSIHQRFHGIIALTENDLFTEDRGPLVKAVIPAFLEPAERRWTYSANRRVGFIGNIAHFPNRLAMEWICTRLAPATAKLDSSIRFRMIGADMASVPPSWRHPSIDFLGLSNRHQVEEEFTQNDIFIAPIDNDYGSKIKLLECISFGAPFLATRSALSGLSFLRDIPLIELEHPEAGARTLCKLIDGKKTLPDLSEKIGLQVQEFRTSQDGVWGRVISNVVQAAS